MVNATRKWSAEVGLIKVKEALYAKGVPVAYMQLVSIPTGQVHPLFLPVRLHARCLRACSPGPFSHLQHVMSLFCLFGFTSCALIKINKKNVPRIVQVPCRATPATHAPTSAPVSLRLWAKPDN